jgi:hypothetical protein
VFEAAQYSTAVVDSRLTALQYPSSPLVLCVAQKSCDRKRQKCYFNRVLKSLQAVSAAWENFKRATTQPIPKLPDQHKSCRLRPESSSARTCTQYQILYNHCLSPSPGSLSFPQAPFSYFLRNFTFLSSRFSSQPIITMSGLATKSLASQDVSKTKNLKDLVICTIPFPRPMASILIPKAQVQTIDRPQSIHDGHTNFGVSFTSKEGFFYARAIVYYKEAAEAHIPGLNDFKRWM